MIRRTGPRRARPAVLIPTYKGEELPAWAPRPPHGGWTPASAWEAALDYAEEHAAPELPESTLALAAYRALLGAVPGLHKSDVLARLNGHHPRKDYLSSSVAMGRQV